MRSSFSSLGEFECCNNDGFSSKAISCLMDPTKCGLLSWNYIDTGAHIIQYFIICLSVKFTWNITFGVPAYIW